MKRQQDLGVLVVLFLVAGVSPGQQDREPRYRGWTASQWSTWVRKVSAEPPGPYKATDPSVFFEGRSALPVLQGLLKDNDPGVRKLAVLSLSRIGDSVLPLLQGMLKDTDPEVRRTAALSMARIGGPDARPAVPVLLDLLRADGSVRKENVDAVLQYGKEARKDAAAVLVAKLKQEMPPSLTTAEAIWRLGDRDTALKVMTDQLTDSDGIRAAEAAGFLGRFGPEASPAVPALVAALKAERPFSTRRAAASALGNIGKAAKPAVPPLVGVLEKTPLVEAAEAVWKLDRHPAAVPALLAILKDLKREYDHSIAVEALTRIGAEAHASGAIVEALKTTTGPGRQWLALTLARIDPTNKAAIPGLAALLQEGQYRDETANALGMLGPEAVPGLLAVLNAPATGPRFVGDGASGTALTKIGPAAVGPLTDALKDPVKRKTAVLYLGKLGPVAKAAVPALLPLLKEEDNTLKLTLAESLEASDGRSLVVPLRLRAAEALWKIVRSKEALTAVTDMLKAPQAERRLAAILLLNRLGVEATAAIPALTAALKDSDAQVRNVAEGALVMMGAPALATFVDMLNTRGADRPRLLRLVDAAAGRALSVAKDADTLATLAGLLKHADLEVRATAARHLARVGGAQARAVLPVFIELLKQPVKPGMRQPVFGGFGALGSDAVPALIELLKDRDPQIRRRALQVLASIGPKAEAAVPALLELVQDAEARADAVTVLRHIGPMPRKLVPGLVEMLRDRDGRVRLAAAYALGGAGAEAKAALPTLIEALKDDFTGVLVSPYSFEQTVRGAAATTLGLLGPEAKDAVAPLTGLLQDRNPRVQTVAAWALGQIGPDARTAVPVLLEAFRGSADGQLRPPAAEVLARVRPLAGHVVPVLRAMLFKDGFDREPLPIVLLGHLGPAAKDAVPELLQVLEYTRSHNRVVAAEALWRIAKHERVIPTLVEILKTPLAQPPKPGEFVWVIPRYEREPAVRLLANIGPEAKAAVPVLLEVVRDGTATDQLKQEARKALLKIDPEAAKVEGSR